MLDCNLIYNNTQENYKNLESIFIPAQNGQLEILPGHAESYILLIKGQIILNLKKTKSKNVEIDNGGCHIYQDKIVIIAELANNAE